MEKKDVATIIGREFYNKLCMKFGEKYINTPRISGILLQLHNIYARRKLRKAIEIIERERR
tara:strand:- start:1280 stop:1462 length:183 start_codon:yes stop_codon:yes gene_type:complete